MMYKAFVVDLTNRTLKVYEHLREWDDYQKYNVSILLNMMVGLLIIPKENEFEELPGDCISEELVREFNESVTKNTYPDESQGCDGKQIVFHIRNSIAHSRLEFKNEDMMIAPVGSIHYVTVSDQKNSGRYEFSCTIEIELLKEIALDFANYIINMV